MITSRDVLLQQIDDAYSHQWESVQSALKKVTPEMAAWQPDCYRNEPPEKDWPPAGTIMWQLAHLTGCKIEYRGILLARPKPPAEFAFTPERTFENLRAALDKAHAQLRAAVADLRDDQLAEQTCREQTVTQFVLACGLHDIWHGSQIKLVQRLWRSKS